MEWIPVGRIGKTHGLKGELKFVPIFTDHRICDNFSQVLLVDGEKLKTATEVETIRGGSSKLIIKFRGCESIGQAKPFIGLTLKARREDFPPLPEGEYYWFQIEGLEVFEENGTYHGRITKILPTGSNDVYIVRDGKRELLLPMIDSVVKTIDLEKRKLVFRAVEGLLEDTPV